MDGTIIVINGASSSGKTSIIRVLQAPLEPPYLDMGVTTYSSAVFNFVPEFATNFYAAVRKYWPALKDGALQPGYAGIRPKIVPRGAPISCACACCRTRSLRPKRYCVNYDPRPATSLLSFRTSCRGRSASITMKRANGRAALHQPWVRGHTSEIVSPSSVTW